MTLVINNLLPAAIWAAFYICRTHWKLDPLGTLMWFRAAIIFFCLLFRYPALRRGPAFQTGIAWISTLLPTIMFWGNPVAAVTAVADLFAIMGSALVGLACIDLGRSFGISPAIRPFVKTGIYKYLSHPIYLGHTLFEFGVWISSPTLWNSLILVLSWILYSIRIRWESKLYQDFTSTTALVNEANSVRNSSAVLSIAKL